MRILLITDLYPIHSSNDPKTILYFVQEWLESGHTVDIIRANFIFNTLIRGKKLFKQQIISDENSKIYNLNFHTPFLFNVKNKLPKEFSIDKYDLVISHMPSGSILANKLIQNTQKPFVCSVHTSDIEVLTNPLYKFYFASELKKAYKNASKISARSFVLKEKIEALIPETKGKTFVAYSGIDENFIEEKLFFIKKIQKLYNTKRLKIATTASLIKRKNIDIIIKALAKFTNYNFELSIIGSGKELRKLTQLTKKLNLKNNIKFLNSLKKEAVLNILKETNLFILLSQKETFGIAYLEAMAKGNLIIATQNDGIDGIIKNEINGFCIQPDEKELQEIIDNIMKLSYIELEKIIINSFNTINTYTKSKAAKNYLDSTLII